MSTPGIRPLPAPSSWGAPTCWVRGEDGTLEPSPGAAALPLEAVLVTGRLHTMSGKEPVPALLELASGRLVAAHAVFADRDVLTMRFGPGARQLACFRGASLPAVEPASAEHEDDGKRPAHLESALSHPDGSGYSALFSSDGTVERMWHASAKVREALPGGEAPARTAPKATGGRAARGPAPRAPEPISFDEALAELKRLCPKGKDRPFPALPGARALDLVPVVKAMPKADLEKRIAARRPPTVFDVQMEPLQTREAEALRLADRVLDEVQERFQMSGLTCFACPVEDVSLVLAPGDARLAAVAALHAHFGGDEERPHDPEAFQAFLGDLISKAPFAVRSVSGSALELAFLGEVEAPRALAATLAAWCSDVTAENGSPDGLDAVAKRLKRERRVRLWWD